MTAPTTTPPSPALVDPRAPTPSAIDQALERARADLAAAPAAGTTAAPAETIAPATETIAPEGETIPAEGETTAAEGETPAAPAAETEEHPELLVELPARHADGEAVNIQFSDQETAELVRQAIRGGLRRDEFHKSMQSVQAQRDELDGLVQHLELDPVGFLAERVRPEIQTELARHLLSIPEVFAEVSREIEEWADPDRYARRQAELARDRSTRSRDTEREIARSREAREQGRIVRQAVETITPDGLDEADAQMFQDDCLADLANYVRQNPQVTRLRSEDIISIVERRLRHYGLSAESALASLSSGQPIRRPPAARRVPTAPAPRTPDADTARTTGATLRQASEQRRAVAAVPGAGAGARPTTIQPPAKQGVKERIAFVKEQLLGRK